MKCSYYFCGTKPHEMKTKRVDFYWHWKEYNHEG